MIIDLGKNRLVNSDHIIAILPNLPHEPKDEMERTLLLAAPPENYSINLNCGLRFILTPDEVDNLKILLKPKKI